MKLEAEERYRDGLTTAWASGSMAKDDSKQYAKELQKQMNGGRAPRRKRATNAQLRELFGAA